MKARVKGQKGTYVYCVVAAPRRPAIGRVAGLPGTGPVRLLDLAHGAWIVAADAPLDRYGEAAISSRLSDLEWVSRTAVAHETVVESFIDVPAVLPMKLFTIFSNDERAVEHLTKERQRIKGLITRVRDHQEWGVRVVLDRTRGTRGDGSRKAPGRLSSPSSGAAYLSRKKAQRDSVKDLAARARETVETLYEQLASRSRQAQRRTASELPIKGGPLLLDAAFLVPRSRSRSFRAGVARAARALGRQGYGVTLTGPWPPYTFVQD